MNAAKPITNLTVMSPEQLREIGWQLITLAGRLSHAQFVVEGGLQFVQIEQFVDTAAFESRMHDAESKQPLAPPRDNYPAAWADVVSIQSNLRVTVLK
jgi:hypothetical protein